VVCAGVKSILDVAATLERLETLSVGLVGFGTDDFPGFYVRDSGHRVGWRLDSVDAVADVARQRCRLGLGQALVVANPIPADDELDRDLHDRTLATALAAMEANGIRGKDVTPYLLGYFHQQTQGRSLAANVALVLNNARLAGQIAMATSG
jgi:pseudouridine-5'-phosphate glycosidase